MFAENAPDVVESGKLLKVTNAGGIGEKRRRAEIVVASISADFSWDSRSEIQVTCCHASENRD